MKNKIAVYYHIWCPDSPIATFLVDEQLKRLWNSGLPNFAKIKCTISGPLSERLFELVSLYDWVEIIEVNKENSHFEGLTLDHLWHDCSQRAVDRVMYFHTKGISHFSGLTDQNTLRKFRAINSWRHLLEWGCIDEWKQNFDRLNKHDVSGVCHCTYPWPHLSGNFFWANASYIRTLPRPINIAIPECPHNYFGQKHRLIYERWIGLGDPKIHTIYNPPFEYNRRGFIPDTIPEKGEPDWFWLYRDDIFPHIPKSELDTRLTCINSSDYNPINVSLDARKTGTTL